MNMALELENFCVTMVSRNGSTYEIPGSLSLKKAGSERILYFQGNDDELTWFKSTPVLQLIFREKEIFVRTVSGSQYCFRV